jgi:hypothetical protein
MPSRRGRVLLPAALALVAACVHGGRAASVSATTPSPLDSAAREYVRLVLTVGAHDPDYVDAYYGPAERKAEAEALGLTLPQARERATALLAALGDRAPASADPLVPLRHRFLRTQLASLVARVDMLGGRRFRFDDESRALYDAVAPHEPESHFRDLVARLDRALPPGAGAGGIPERYQAFRAAFVIPRERLDAVFAAAIDACRERTRRHVALPDGESFVVEYVKDKPWSGYNWYKGGYRSVIQVNTDLPVYIDRALDLACHEGYPGHHVYNALLERHLVRGRGWEEFSVYPLFSPQSLIAEGSANYGIEMAFPGAERVAFERATLFPAAGLDPARAEQYYRVQDLVHALSYAGNEAARRYLDGEIDARAAAEWLERYALMSPQAAAQRVRFFDRYRSYVINYNLGQDLVKQYVERAAGAGAGPDARWAAFSGLLSSPRLPSDLR